MLTVKQPYILLDCQWRVCGEGGGRGVGGRDGGGGGGGG